MVTARWVSRVGRLGCTVLCWSHLGALRWLCHLQLDQGSVASDGLASMLVLTIR